MARGIRFLPAARDDLLSLDEYIANESGPIVSRRYTDRLRAACDALATFPRSGRRYPYAAKELRTISVERRAVVAYVVERDEIRIARILYGGRDVERALLSLLAAPDDGRT